MNKKILTLLLVVAVATTVTFVSAAETVTVNGLEFNIPDGYSLTTDQFSVSAYGQDGDSALLENTNGDAVLIGVLDNNDNLNLGDIDSLSDSSGQHTNKTIAGHEGLFKQGEKAVFIYLEDSKIVVISASDESSIETMIK